GMLVDYGARPDGILTSTAKRARQTAKAFSEAFGMGKDQVIAEEQLYHAWPDTIEANVRKLPEDWHCVLVFGHNPGYTDLANLLRHDEFIGNVPTCGIVFARQAVKNWVDFRLKEARRIDFYYPKQVL
ncbi:MAG: hypothetical protein AAGA31_12390, partial [Bacteroidota bacterium]